MSTHNPSRHSDAHICLHMAFRASAPRHPTPSVSSVQCQGEGKKLEELMEQKVVTAISWGDTKWHIESVRLTVIQQSLYSDD